MIEDLSDDHDAIKKLPPNSHVILGVPYDIAGEFSGARYGPDRVRSALSNFLNKIHKHKECGQYDLYDFDLKKIYDVKNFSIKDVGNISYNINEAPVSIGIEVERSTRNIFANDHTPIVIGGDHSFTYYVVKAALEKYERINLIQFDAHHDTYLNNEHQKSALSHGNFIAALLRTELIDLYQYGVRTVGFLSDESLSFLKKRKKGYSSIEVLRTEPGELFSGIDKNIPCYISIDADVISPGIIPNVGNPIIGGIDHYTIQNLLQYLIANYTVIGFDFMELCDAKNAKQMDEGEEIFAKLILNILLSKVPSRELNM